MNKLLILFCLLSISMMPSLLLAQDNIAKGYGKYYYQCGCNYTFYYNGFDEVPLPPAHPFVHEHTSLDGYPMTPQSASISDDGDYLQFHGEYLNIINCFMPGQLTKISGYYKTDKGHYLKIFVDYRTNIVTNTVQLESVQYCGLGKNNWRKFEYYVDFTHFETDEELTNLTFYVEPPNDGVIHEVLIDEISMCTYCDGEIRKYPKFSKIIIQDDADNTLKELSGNEYSHEYYVPNDITQVKFIMVLPGDVNPPDYTVTVNNSSVPFQAPGFESDLFTAPEYLPFTVHIKLQKGPASDCDFNMYTIVLKRDKQSKALISNIEIDPRGHIHPDFNPYVSNGYLAPVPPGYPTISVIPYASNSDLELYVNDIPTESGVGVDITWTTTGQNPVRVKAVLPGFDQKEYLIRITDTYFYFAKSKDEYPESNNNANISISLSALQDVPVKIDYYLGSERTATPKGEPEEDFDLTEGLHTMEIGPGNLFKVLSIPLTHDTKTEGNEYFILYLQENPTTQIPVFFNTSHTAIIVDDDFHTVQFTSPVFYVNEGGGWDHDEITAVIDECPTNYLAKAWYEYLAGGTAVPGEDGDFVLDPDYIIWGNSTEPGCEYQPVPILPIDNDVIQPNKDLYIGLSPVEMTTIGAVGQTNVIIVDDDKYTVQFDEDPNFMAIQEPESGDLPIAITLTVNINQTVSTGEGPVIVRFVAGDASTAEEDLDYVFVTSTVQWLAGEGGTKQITLSISPDQILNEPDELISVEMGKIIGAKPADPSEFLLTITEFSNLIFVDKNASGENNGLRWEDAFNHIQDALEYAETNMPYKSVEIRIAEGHYYPDEGKNIINDKRDVNFSLASGITLKGGYPHGGDVVNQPEIYITELNGDITQDDDDSKDITDPLRKNNNNTQRIVTCKYPATIEDVTICNGYSGDGEAGYGPAVSGPAVIKNCVIKNNYLLSNEFGGNVYHPVSVENCHFENNYVIGETGYGGAISADNTLQKLDNCVFKSNFGFNGGAIHFTSNNPGITVKNCTFDGNSSHYGGAITISGEGVTAAINCKFVNNESLNEGGAIYISNTSVSDALFGNCLFYNNIGYSGTIFSNSSNTFTFNSCTFYQNTSNTGSAINVINTAIENCIFWQNSGQADINATSLTISRCALQQADLIDPPNVIELTADPFESTDPAFPEKFLHLNTGSPCLDYGSSPSALFLQLCDNKDLAGFTRIQNGTIDLGAYEGPFQDVAIYELTVSDNGNGTTIPSGTVNVYHGVPYDINYISNAGHIFTHWETVSGTGVTFNGNNSVTLTGGNAEIRAHFQKYYILNVTSSTGGCATNPSGAQQVILGVPFPVEAELCDGHTFANWTVTSGDATIDDPNSPTTTVTLNTGDATVQANYDINVYTVNVGSNGNGTVNPSGDQQVNHGGTLNVTATPSPNYHFTNWSVTGDIEITDGDETGVFTVTGPGTIRANFAIEEYTVTFIAGPNGSITGNLSQTVPHGGNCTQVEAVPDQYYHFDGWTGDYNGMTNPLTITNVTSDMNITATFNTYTLTIIPDYGDVTKSPNQSTYAHGTVVELTAIPNVGHHFDRWQGHLSGSTNPEYITMDDNKTVFAYFEPNQYTVTFNAGPNGNVNGTNQVVQQIPYGGDCSPVTANADPDYYFDGWTGGYTGTANPLIITNVTSDITTTANFPHKFTVSFQNTSGSGYEDVGSHSLNVLISPTPTTGITINGNYSISGTAVSGTHYSNVSPASPITFNAGQSSRTVSFDIIDNSIVDADRTVIFTLTSADPSNIAMIGANNTYSYTIMNNEVQVTISADPSGYGTTVPEGSFICTIGGT